MCRFMMLNLHFLLLYSIINWITSQLYMDESKNRSLRFPNYFYIFNIINLKNYNQYQVILAAGYSYIHIYNYYFIVWNC
jgi:hypothetical protein